MAELAVANPDEANALFAEAAEQEVEELEDLAELQQTRTQLEQPAMPATDGGAAVADEETADDARATDTGTDADPAPDGYRMTGDRRLGVTHFTVTYYDDDENEREERFKFGMPNGLATREIIGPIEEKEDEPGATDDITDWAWATLASWVIEPYDPPGVEDTTADDWAFWAKNMTIADSFDTLRQVATGGNDLQL